MNDNIDCVSIGTSSNDGKYKNCDDLNLNTFTYTDYRDNDNEGDINPVNNSTSMTASTFRLINFMRHLIKIMDYL